MSLVVRQEGTVPLPEELAQEFGIHEGTLIEWERTPDGRLALSPSPARRDAVERLSGILKPYLKEQGGGVEAFLKWREEDARLDGSL